MKRKEKKDFSDIRMKEAIEATNKRRKKLASGYEWEKEKEEIKEKRFKVKV